MKLTEHMENLIRQIDLSRRATFEYEMKDALHKIHHMIEHDHDRGDTVQSHIDMLLHLKESADNDVEKARQILADNMKLSDLCVRISDGPVPSIEEMLNVMGKPTNDPIVIKLSDLLRG